MAQARGVRVDVEEHLLEYERPYLYPKQLAAIFDPRRYSFVEATTKAGKTAGCIIWLLEQAFSGRDGQNFWWVAPVSGQADIAFRRMTRAIPAGLAQVNLTLKTITLVNGAVIWFKSGDKPDSLYGEDVYAAVCDEASRIKEDSWFALRSTLTATRGPVRVIGNVKGRKNWFYQLARKAEKGDDPNYGYHKITAADAVEAHILDAEEIEDARRTLPPHVFAELYEAKAADDGGNPFGLGAIERCVDPVGLAATRAVAWGWDLAKSQDWTVGLGLDEHGRVCRFHRFQKSWDETEAIILRETDAPALVDSTGVGSPVIEKLQKKARAGITFEGLVFTTKSKQMLMEGLQTAIATREIRFPDQPATGMHFSDPGHIRAELENFEYQYTKTGVLYSAPEGFHDDCVMSLALARQQKFSGKVPMLITKELVAKAARGGRRR